MQLPYGMLEQAIRPSTSSLVGGRQGDARSCEAATSRVVLKAQPRLEATQTFIVMLTRLVCPMMSRHVSLELERSHLPRKQE